MNKLDTVLELTKVIIKQIGDAVIFLIGWIFPRVFKFINSITQSVVRRKKTKQARRKALVAINTLLPQVNKATVSNQNKLSYSQELYKDILAKGGDVGVLKKMVDYCDEVKVRLKRYSRDLNDVLNKMDQNKLNKLNEIPNYIMGLRYPMSWYELKRLHFNYYGPSVFIRTLLEYAHVNNIQHVSGLEWTYSTDLATYVLNVDDNNGVHIVAKPRKVIIYQGQTISQSFDEEYKAKIFAFFNRNRQFRICSNCPLYAIDHYDVSELFDYVQRIILKSGIISNESNSANKISINQTKAKELINYVNNNIRNIKQTAPPPVDNVPDVEKEHGGRERWAEIEDIKSKGLLKEKGFIIGKMGYGSFIYSGEYLGNILTIAPARTGKGVGVIIPNLLRHSGSTVVFDPKGENFFVTGRKRSQLGNKVYYFDPFNIVENYKRKHSDLNLMFATKASINPLDLILLDRNRMVERALIIASSLVDRADGEGNRNNNGTFFYNETETLLANLMIFVCTSYPPESRNLYSLRELIMLPYEQLYEKLSIVVEIENERRGIKTHSQVTELLTWLNTHHRDAAFNNIFSYAQQATQFIATSETIRQSIISSNIEIQNIRNNPTSLYLILDLDNQVMAGTIYKPFVRLIMTTCMLGSTIGDTIAPTQMLFMLDEIAQFGNVSYLPKLLASFASRRIVVWTIWQNIAQIKENYGEYECETIMANCGIHQYFGVNDPTTAKYVCDKVGNTTIYKRAIQMGNQHNIGVAYAEANGTAHARGTSRQQTSNTGHSYQGFNYTIQNGQGNALGEMENHTDSYNFSKTIQLGISRTRGVAITKEVVPLLVPAEAERSRNQGVQFVFYKEKCAYPILCGRIRYFEEMEYYGEYDKNITLG